jgi:hypothetical protein
MVSFATILRKLMDGEYLTSTGNPDSPRHFESFVKEVKSRVEELRDLPPKDVEDKVLEAVSWAIHTICSPLRSWDYISETGEYYIGITLYRCSHPTTGKFYMVVREEESASVGEAFFGFGLYRDYKTALKTYTEEKKYEEEYIKEKW